MKRLLVVIAMAFAAACGGNTPLAPSQTAPATPTFNLSGTVTSTTGQAIVGASVRIVDGPNAGRAAATDGAGAYSFTGLTQSGFTLSISATNYSTASRGVTLTSTQTLNVQLASLFANMVGAWTGTVTFSALGLSGSCNISWLITAQNGGSFSGTYQETGGTGCPQAGSFDGTISSANVVTFRRTSVTVGNGASCTDSNVISNGLLSGSTVTIQTSFIRSCTNPNTTFAESQTLSVTKR
jgi:hypothetical protein